MGGDHLPRDEAGHHLLLAVYTGSCGIPQGQWNISVYFSLGVVCVSVCVCGLHVCVCAEGGDIWEGG